MTTVVHPAALQGFSCDRCGRWEVGKHGVTEPEAWVAEGSADAHLCPACVIDEPRWTAEEVAALGQRVTRAVTRSIEVQETFQAVRAQAIQVQRRRARRPSMELRLPSTLGSAARSRRLVTEFCEDVNVETDDLALLTSELVTNALMHTGTSATRQVVVWVRLDPSSLLVQVDDDGPGVPAELSAVEPGPAGGRGLQIVDALADGWGSGAGVVWFRLRHGRRELLHGLRA